MWQLLVKLFPHVWFPVQTRMPVLSVDPRAYIRPSPNRGHLGRYRITLTSRKKYPEQWLLKKTRGLYFTYTRKSFLLVCLRTAVFWAEARTGAARKGADPQRWLFVSPLLISFIGVIISVDCLCSGWRWVLIPGRWGHADNQRGHPPLWGGRLQYPPRQAGFSQS